MNVFFDVQGTLLTMEEVPRPHAREAFLRLKEQGHDLYLWSSGGAGYAAAAADLLGVADLVSDYFNKRQEPGVSVDFALASGTRRPALWRTCYATIPVLVASSPNSNARML